jgi:adenylyltransferase/sulfurtransferase
LKKGRAARTEGRGETAAARPLRDVERERYSRHLLLPDFDEAAQRRLLTSRVLVVGLGGLGSPVAMYLAASGVGELLLADFDAVDLSNLQRQILHGTASVGRSKVDSAIDALRALNPEVHLEPIKGALGAERLAGLATTVDLICDCSDNFATRDAVNAASVNAGIPLVSGAAIRTEGQVACFSGLPGDPCYRCLYPDLGDGGETCAREGVLAPLVGIIGSMQAAEVLKILTGLGRPLFGRLLLLDALTMEWRGVGIPADPECAVCAQRREHAPAW